MGLHLTVSQGDQMLVGDFAIIHIIESRDDLARIRVAVKAPAFARARRDRSALKGEEVAPGVVVFTVTPGDKLSLTPETFAWVRKAGTGKYVFTWFAPAEVKIFTVFANPADQFKNARRSAAEATATAAQSEHQEREEAERKRRDELRKRKHSVDKSWVAMPDGTIHFTAK
jgi:hypothetical protein